MRLSTNDPSLARPGLKAKKAKLGIPGAPRGFSGEEKQWADKMLAKSAKKAKKSKKKCSRKKGY